MEEGGFHMDSCLMLMQRIVKNVARVRSMHLTGRA